MELTLSKEDQGVVIFHVWKSLPYTRRLILSFSLIAIGFIMQYYYIPGSLLFILGGNSLLLVKGYDNRIKLGKYSAEGEWIKTDEEHIRQIVAMNRKLEKWDESSIDITNKRGVAFFVGFLVILLIFFIYADASYNYFLKTLLLDAFVLFVPHWFFGLKRITKTPLLLQKIRVYNKVLKEFEGELKRFKIELLIYVKGKEQKLPDDIKVKIMQENAPEGFMGMYAQISLNNVEGKNYPYFYTVFVAKKEFQLTNKYFDKIVLPKRIIKEAKVQDNMDIIIIRQFTTKTGGYHTAPPMVSALFKTSLDTLTMIKN